MINKWLTPTRKPPPRPPMEPLPIPGLTWDLLERQLTRMARGSPPRHEIAAWVGKIAKQSRWVPPEMTLRAILEGAAAIANGGLPRLGLLSGLTNTS